MAAPLRLGLIGAGRWGRNYIKTIAALDGACLAALASGNPDSVQLVPAGCSVSPDWRTILDRKLIDAIIIATPPALHARMAEAAVEVGLPVLVEKPLTLDLGEAIALREFVAFRKGFVMVGHTHLFHPAYRTLKRLQPGYGAVRAIDTEAGNMGPFRTDVPVLWDWGAHDVAMCLDLLRAIPHRIQIQQIEQRIAEGGTGEVIRIAMSFPGGIQAEIRVGNILPRSRRFSVHAEAAVLEYDDLALHKLTVASKQSGRGIADKIPVPLATEMPLSNVVKDFVRAVETGQTDDQSIELGVNVVRVLSQRGV